MKRRSVKHEDDEHDDRNDADAFDGFFSKRVGGFKERISQSRQVTGGEREERREMPSSGREPYCFPFL